MKDVRKECSDEYSSPTAQVVIQWIRKPTYTSLILRRKDEQTLTSDDCTAELQTHETEDHEDEIKTYVWCRGNDTEQPLVFTSLCGVRILCIDSELRGPEEICSIDD